MVEKSAVEIVLFCFKEKKMACGGNKKKKVKKGK